MAVKSALMWILVLVSLALGEAFSGEPWANGVAGCAAVALAVLFGYRYEPGPRLTAAWGRLWRGLAVPYVAWLVLLGGTVVAAASLRAGAPARDAALAVLRGGPGLGAPLAGHWLLGALLVGLLLMHGAQAWLAVDPGWLLPAALALTAGAPLLVGAPLDLGLGSVFLTWLVLGRLLRRLRWRGEPGASPVLAAGVLAIGVLAAVVLATGAVGTVAPPAGQTGAPIVGPLVAGCVGAAVVVLADRVARHLPPGVRRVLAAAEPLGVTGLATYGLGSWLAPTAWPRGAVLAACLAAALACAGAVTVLPRTRWLTGAGLVGDVPGRPGWGRRLWARLAALGAALSPQEPDRPRSETGGAPPACALTGPETSS